MTKGQHLEQVKILRYRGLSDLKLDRLGKFNLLLGSNDVGKTSVLEAIFLLTGISNLDLPMGVQGWRELPIKKFEDLRLLFHNLDPDHPIEIECRSHGAVKWRHLKISARVNEIEISAETPFGKGGGNSNSHMRERSMPNASQASSVIPPGRQLLNYVGSIQFRQGETSTFLGTIRVNEGTIELKGDSSTKSANELTLPARYVSPGPGYDADAFGALVIRKKVARLVSFMQNINDRIADISTSGNLVYADIGLDQMVPLNVFGSGMVRAVNILAHLMLGNERLLMIDELENGLHYTAVNPLLRVLLSLSQDSDVQVIASTHSVGVLKSLLDVLGEDKFAKHRSTTLCYSLQRDCNRRVHPYRYDYEQFEHCIEHGVEIR